MSSKKEHQHYKYKTFTKSNNDIRDSGYSGLANAVILQALIDYDTAIRRTMENDFTNSNGDYSKCKCKRYIEEVNKFVDSEYFNLLTKLDGDYLLSIVHRKICKDYGVDRNGLPV